MGDDYDLEEALSVSRGPGVSIGDVAERVAYHSESPEGYASTEVFAVLRLKDGRFAAVEAGCDTTGWDCQAGGDVYVGDSLEDVVRNGLTREGREVLNYSIDSEEAR